MQASPLSLCNTCLVRPSMSACVHAGHLLSASTLCLFLYACVQYHACLPYLCVSSSLLPSLPLFVKSSIKPSVFSTMHVSPTSACLPLSFIPPLSLFVTEVQSDRLMPVLNFMHASNPSLSVIHVQSDRLCLCSCTPPFICLYPLSFCPSVYFKCRSKRNKQ